MASHHVARLCNVGSSPSLSWLLFERRGGGGRCQKQRARARPRAYTCTETEQKGCTCNGIHDRVCRLFHRPGRMQDVTCLTISSHSTNPPLPSRSSSSLLSLCLSSRPFGSWPTRPRDCLPLAYRLMQLYVLRQFAPICRCVLSLSLSICLFSGSYSPLAPLPPRFSGTTARNGTFESAGFCQRMLSREDFATSLGWKVVGSVRCSDGRLRCDGRCWYDYKIVYYIFYWLLNIFRKGWNVNLDRICGNFLPLKRVSVIFHHRP